MKGKTFVVIVAATITACVPALDTRAADDLAEVQQALAAIDAKIEQAMYTGDWETVIGYHTEDAVICANAHAPIVGRDAMRAAQRENEKEQVKYLSFHGTVEDFSLCGDRVFRRGAFAMSATSRRSTQPVALHGAFSDVWQKQPDGRWLIAYVIWNLGFDPCGGGK